MQGGLGPVIEGLQEAEKRERIAALLEANARI